MFVIGLVWLARGCYWSVWIPAMESGGPLTRGGRQGALYGERTRRGTEGTGEGFAATRHQRFSVTLFIIAILSS